MASWRSWASPFPRPPSPSIWFAIARHRPILGGAFSIIIVKDLVSLDFFTLPTATFRVLFVFIVLRHDRRRIVHFKCHRTSFCRATEGFLNRLLASNLTLDRRFVSELRQHLKSMNGNP